MLWWAVIALIISIVIIHFMKSQPRPINGVYMQPGPFHRIKFWLIYALLQLHKRQNATSQSERKNAGYGVKSRSSIEDMDKTQPLPAGHPMAVDAVYFNGANRDGQYIVAATARRQKGCIQTILYLRIPDLGLLQLPTLPDTELYADKEMAFFAGGLELQPVIPMKKWKMIYDGKMRLIKVNEEKAVEVNVKFNLDWDALTQYFDFDTDMHPTNICDALARETWSRKLFNNLKVAHQTHYEQFGEISGTVYIENYGDTLLNIQGVRDHSYGNLRDWHDLHRYCIQYLHLENGSSICIGIICMPRTFSRLVIGYIFQPDGRLDTVSGSDFELYKVGEDGNPPTDFMLSFTAGGKTYNLEGHVLESPIFYIGVDWEARIHERMCTFTVNGIAGWGISEWNYRNYTGRPDIYCTQKKKT